MSVQDLLSFIVESLVDDPEKVVVEAGERRGEPTLQVSVAEGDRGAVIGRGGRTIRAIETVLSAASRGRAPAVEIAD